MANKAAFLLSEKGDFVVEDAEIGEPGENEILIRVCDRAMCGDKDS